MFCPHEKCEHYSTATKYPRKCYYEPQCWRGYVDAMILVIRLRFSKKGGEGARTGLNRMGKDTGLGI